MSRRAPEILVLAMDIGSSSLRTALFDERGQRIFETSASRDYAVRYTPDGGAELSPVVLRRAAANCLHETLNVYRAARSLKKIPIAAVGGSAFWHSLLGLDRTSRPITPIYTWADSRSAHDARRARAT
jgi:gluconokinase